MGVASRKTKRATTLVFVIQLHVRTYILAKYMYVCVVLYDIKLPFEKYWINKVSNLQHRHHQQTDCHRNEDQSVELYEHVQPHLGYSTGQLLKHIIGRENLFKRIALTMFCSCFKLVQ